MAEGAGKRKGKQEEAREETEHRSLEQAFAGLDEMIAALESEDITLEESFTVYKDGMRLLKYCNDTIDRVEKKVLKINEDGGLDEF